jgi:hypothetical protein
MFIVKLIKGLALVALLAVFVSGGALAFNDGNGNGHQQAHNPYSAIVRVSGLTEDEIASIKEENCQTGTNLIDYLKEEGLHEQWYASVLSELELKLETLVENEVITSEEANQLLSEYQELLNGNPPYQIQLGQRVGNGQRRR